MGMERFRGWYRFSYHRVTEAPRNFVGRARIRTWWEWHCRGWYAIFSPPRTPWAQTEILARAARIRAWWEWRIVGDGTGVFHHKDTKSTKILYGGKARIRQRDGSGALSGMVQVFFTTEVHRGHREILVGSHADSSVVGTWRFVGVRTGFFHHRGTEGTKIFYGGKARIRIVMELRVFGEGTGFLTTEDIEKACTGTGTDSFVSGNGAFIGAGIGALPTEDT